jgi:hypothetical protein
MPLVLAVLQELRRDAVFIVPEMNDCDCHIPFATRRGTWPRR